MLRIDQCYKLTYKVLNHVFACIRICEQLCKQKNTRTSFCKQVNFDPHFPTFVVKILPERETGKQRQREGEEEIAIEKPKATTHVKFN